HALSSCVLYGQRTRVRFQNLAGQERTGAPTGKMQPGQPVMIDSALDRLQLELDDLATGTMFSLVWRHFRMR
ncbi:MAG: hypothetical protein ACPIOQ_84635, partial [Promethearchaeia archaeon]